MPGLYGSGVAYNQLQASVDEVYPQQQRVIDSLAAACNAEPLIDIALSCNAFNTAGQLMLVSPNPTFSTLDTTDPSIDYCDGVYIARGKSSTGLDLTETGETTESLAAKGRIVSARLRALKVVVDKVRGSSDN